MNANLRQFRPVPNGRFGRIAIKGDHWGSPLSGTGTGGCGCVESVAPVAARSECGDRGPTEARPAADEGTDASAVAGRPERSVASWDTSSATRISERTYCATGRRVRTETRGTSDAWPAGGEAPTRSVAARGMTRISPSGSRISNRPFPRPETGRTTGNVRPKQGCCGSVTVTQRANRSSLEPSRCAW